MAAQFDTQELQGPFKDFGGPDPAAFNTMELPAPYRVTQGYPAPPPSSHTRPGPQPSASGGEAPILQSTGGSADAASTQKMSQSLAVADIALRCATVVVLLVGVAVMASASQPSTTLSFTSISATEFGFSTALIGLLYSLYQGVSATLRLALGKPLLPGNASTMIAYIGDQVIAGLLLSGGTTPAAVLMYDHEEYQGCEVAKRFCDQVAGATSMIFIGFALVVASMVISTYCFYKNKL